MYGRKLADLKTLTEKIRCPNLFCEEVPPFGLLNDTESKIEVVFDANLITMPFIGVHPDTNTITV